MRSFMAHWFDGFSRGLEKLDEAARRTLLSECGRACARSHTAEVFQRAWTESRDLPAFLHRLAKQFPEARYQVLDDTHFDVMYVRCACDLVISGLMDSPALCTCSLYNLKENLEGALKHPVHVEMKSSILEGAPECRFRVTLNRYRSL